MGIFKTYSFDSSRLKALNEAIFDAVCIVDIERRVTSCNPGFLALTGFQEEHLKDKACKDILGSEDIERNFLCSIDFLLSEACESKVRVAPRRIAIKTAQGTRLDCLASACPVFDDKGNCQGAALYFREVTNELKIEQLKSDFLSVVSHELRIPLATIKESISLLSDGAAGAVSDNQRNILSTVRSQIDRLAGLVESLLDVSSIESGRFRVRRKKIDLNELSASMRNFFKPVADKKSIKLEVLAPAEHIFCIGDADRLTQVFSNLLNNALRFTPEKGAITISVGKRDKYFVQVNVSDTGPGIAPELKDKLFEKFQQLGIDESKRRGGAGLGLAISKRIIEDLGGEISVESSPQEGAKFTFTLPIYSEDLELQLELEASIKEAKQRQTALAVLKLETAYGENESENALKAIMLTIRGPNDKAIQSDKFIYVLLGQTDKSGIASVKERIRLKLAKMDMDTGIKRSAVAVYPDDGLTLQELEIALQKNTAEF